MPIVKGQRLSFLPLVAAIFFASAAPPAHVRAQNTPIPSGRLVFRSSYVEFRPEGTFEVHTVLEGIGEVRSTGTWKAQSTALELTGYDVVAGAELLKAMSVPLAGCGSPGQYRFEVNGKQLRLSAVGDACVPRLTFLDKTRWAPPGEPNLVPPRAVTRTMFDAAVRLPRASDGSGSWPSFRGPQAAGVADGQQLPDSWNGEKGENIRWRTSIPGLGHSSPIVWGDRLFVTSAISSLAGATYTVGPYNDADASNDISSHQFVLYALDTTSGKVVWQKTAFEGPPRDKRHVKSTYASSTPATDGRVVVAWFGSQGLFAYTVEGTPLWTVDLGRVNAGGVGTASIEWGPASSPVIWDGLVIVQVDTQDDSFLLALSVETGAEVWKTIRDEGPSWSSPTVVATANGAELVVNGANFARGYDPRTGRERWRVASGSPIPTPTPISAGGVSIVTSGGFGSSRPLVAVPHGAGGVLAPADPSVTAKGPSQLAWSITNRAPFTPTPLAYRGLLYVVATNGVLDAFDVQTGAEVYRARLPQIGSGFSASPIAADGKLYLSNEDGSIAIVAAERTFRHVATNDIGEPIMATPALSRGVMFVRSMTNVLAIGRKP
ncbi:MAG TPA: PQQ-binding-like beta-propeller repeat protein [Vicinamibacterales bacterium]